MRVNCDLHGADVSDPLNQVKIDHLPANSTSVHNCKMGSSRIEMKLLIQIFINLWKNFEIVIRKALNTMFLKGYLLNSLIKVTPLTSRNNHSATHQMCRAIFLMQGSRQN